MNIQLSEAQEGALCTSRGQIALQEFCKRLSEAAEIKQQQQIRLPVRLVDQAEIRWQETMTGYPANNMCSYDLGNDLLNGGLWHGSILGNGKVGDVLCDEKMHEIQVLDFAKLHRRKLTPGTTLDKVMRESKRCSEILLDDRCAVALASFTQDHIRHIAEIDENNPKECPLVDGFGGTLFLGSVFRLKISGVPCAPCLECHDEGNLFSEQCRYGFRISLARLDQPDSFGSPSCPRYVAVLLP
jgi:hypothetical protein